jgi:hypothetical protein
MQYPCPESADFVNVHALNAEFIAISLRRGERPELAGLSAQALQRLASVPFLLFSLQCDKRELWERLFDGTTDLADQAQHCSEDWAALSAGTLAFLWSLARKDRHSARLFSGCSDRWCATLARRRLICVTNRMLQAGVRPEIRIDPASDAWNVLVTEGVSRDSELRDAASIGLFQALSLSREKEAALASAACRIPSAARIRR